MNKLAISAVVAMTGLTLAAIGIIVLVDEPPDEAVLSIDDFKALGLRVAAFRQTEVRLPGGETRRRWTADLGPDGEAVIEIRSGATRVAYADQLRGEVDESGRPRGSGDTRMVIEERWGETPAFVVRRIEGPAVSAEAWALEGTAIVIARRTTRAGSLDERRDRMNDAEQVVRQLALVAVRHVIETARRAGR
jgi:hypothetical protein